MLEAPALDSSEFIDVTDPDEELYDVSRRCDWVVADSNSNVHLQVLRAGIPTVAVDELSVRQGGRRDAYGFISSGIVYSADTIDAFRSMLLVDASSFYSGDWSQRFRHFDASYLGDERALASTARARIAEVIHSSAARGPIESRTLKLKVQ
jgi:hypothetical protein